MKLREDCIGLRMGSRIGMITITNDKSKFKLYKKLGLDIFQKNDTTKKSNSKPEHSVKAESNDK